MSALSKAQYLFEQADEGGNVQSFIAKDAAAVAAVAQAESLDVIARELEQIRKLLERLVEGKGGPHGEP